MAPLNVHAPDPEHPKGMAWVLGVGMIDPRKGNKPRQPMALIQSWEPTSELWWDLGLRWHPELATKWAKGGGQFMVADVIEQKPTEPEITIEQGAEAFLEHLGEEHPQYAEMLKVIRESGSDEDRAKLADQLGGEITRLLSLVNYIKTKPKE